MYFLLNIVIRLIFHIALFVQQLESWRKKALKNIPVSKLFISNLHKKDREEWGKKGREERKRIKGLKRKLSNTDGNMRDNVTRYICFVEIYNY